MIDASSRRTASRLRQWLRSQRGGPKVKARVIGDLAAAGLIEGVTTATPGCYSLTWQVSAAGLALLRRHPKRRKPTTETAT